MTMAFTALSALVPSILLVIFFKQRDVHPEPSGVLWMTFILGVLSTIPTLIVALPVMALLTAATSDLLALGVGQAFLCAALPEELFKLAVVYLYVRKHEAFDEPMDGIVYGVIASLGFATFENILYSLEGGLNVALMRAFTAVPMHAACGAIMGYYIGQAEFTTRDRSASRGLWIKGYLFAVLIHGIYDAPLLWIEALTAEHGGVPADTTAAVLGGMVLTLVTLVIGVVWALRLVKRLRAEQLELVARGGFVQVDDPSASLSAEALEPPVPRGSALAGWVMIIAGFLLASVGALMLLGGILALATDAVSAQELGEFLVGIAVLSTPTLGAGVPLFIVGLRKLPSKQRRRTQVEQWRRPG